MLTYGELDAPGRPAGAPPARPGVGPGRAGRRSAWSARRSWWSAILGVLKAGGAYVPLDPAYPRGAAGLHAGGRRAARCCVTAERLRGGAVPATARAARPPTLATRLERGGAATRRPPAIRRTGQPRLRHLHLRLDRARPRGWSMPPPRRRQPDRWQLAARRSAPAPRTACSLLRTPSLRRLGLGDLLRPAAGGAAGADRADGARAGPAALARLARASTGVASAYLPPSLLAELSPSAAAGRAAPPPLRAAADRRRAARSPRAAAGAASPRLARGCGCSTATARPRRRCVTVCAAAETGAPAGGAAADRPAARRTPASTCSTPACEPAPVGVPGELLHRRRRRSPAATWAGRT